MNSPEWGHSTSVEDFGIVGRKAHSFTITIKQPIYIRVNSPILNRNIGKHNLPYIWDRIMFTSSEFKIMIQQDQQESTVHNTTLVPSTQEVLWRRSFCVDLMNSSCKEGKTSHSKLNYSVILEPDITYDQHFMYVNVWVHHWMGKYPCPASFCLMVCLVFWHLVLANHKMQYLKSVTLDLVPFVVLVKSHGMPSIIKDDFVKDIFLTNHLFLLHYLGI